MPKRRPQNLESALSLSPALLNNFGIYPPDFGSITSFISFIFLFKLRNQLFYLENPIITWPIMADLN